MAMNGHRTSPPPTTKQTTAAAASCFNRFLSSMTLVALGAIGGFGIFHSALQHRIEQTEYSHNATLAIVTGRFAESEIERNRCIETDSGRLQEISELRGRLDAQYKSWYDLSAAQRSMLSEQRESKAQIQQFREVFGRDQRTLASLRAESDQKSRDLTSIQEDLAVARANLETYHRANAELETELTKLREAKKEETNDLQFQVKGKDLELENALENLDRIAQQNDQLKMENQELQLEIRQKDEELDTLQENSDALLTQKKKLEQHVAEMSDEMEKLSSQIVEKEKELSEYREEEGELEIKLTNFRDGMLVLLEEKVNEIQDLEHRIDSLNEEKADLEKKLDHWRDGMLKLLKEKIEEIEGLKLVLAESRKSMNHMMHEIELARSEQVEAEKFVRERLDTLDHSNSDPEEKEMIKELLQEIERVRAELRESQEWVVSATKDIEHRQSDQVKSEALILDKTNEIKNLKLRIERDQNSAKEEISKLELDLAEARKLVEEKTNQVEHLSSELKNFVVEINELKSVLAGASIDQNDMLGSPTTEMMIDHIQQRDGVVCRQLFGRGPYYVKFVVQLPSDESNDGGGDAGKQTGTAFFVIELPSRKELPHSTYTFLTLVESNLFNDSAAFLSAQDNGGLKIASSNSQNALSLEHKLKPLGFTNGSSLGFVETSISGKAPPCGEYSLGFVDRGPGLNLFLPNTEKTDNECFACVIRGQKDLEKIQFLLQENREPLEIISAKHLRVD